MAGIALSSESNFWLFYYYDCFEPWCICDDSTAVCSCSDCIGIQCGPDGSRISCWLDRTQDDHITSTASIASLSAHAHRLAMQDQLYKELFAVWLYWFVYLWWVKKHVLHGITECISIDFRTDCTSTAYTHECLSCLSVICILCVCDTFSSDCIHADCTTRHYPAVLHLHWPTFEFISLIPELIHLHWLCHGLHQGHNWLQCIAYSLHCRCVICHVFACISTA